jgi:hypothetical protein
MAYPACTSVVAAGRLRIGIAYDTTSAMTSGIVRQSIGLRTAQILSRVAIVLF